MRRPAITVVWTQPVSPLDERAGRRWAEDDDEDLVDTIHRALCCMVKR